MVIPPIFNQCAVHHLQALKLYLFPGGDLAHSRLRKLRTVYVGSCDLTCMLRGRIRDELLLSSQVSGFTAALLWGPRKD